MNNINFADPIEEDSMKNQAAEEATLREIFDLMQNWIGESRLPDTPVINYLAPEELSKKLDFGLREKGGGNERMLEEVKQYLTYAVRTANPAYLNQLFGGFGFPGFVGELITALTNTSMYTYEVAPVATLMEKTLIEKMISFTGWGQGEGIFTSGGSQSNLYAMLLARNATFPEVKNEGISALPKLAVLVSERSHFSLLKGANTIGIGHNGVVKVKVDDRGRMRGQAAAEALEQTIKKGMVPFMVCSTAGTTETGSFDAIDEIADMAEKYGLWHHVDGSWGGSLILSEKYQPLFKGLHRADSFTWNPHKLMSIPLTCSAFMAKDKGVMRREIQSNDADYIYHDYDNSEFDTGPSSLSCGRRVDSLKLWLSWNYWGEEGYRERVEKCMGLADYATKRVKESDHLELMFTTESLNVNFRFVVPDEVNVDEFNKRLRYDLVQKGHAMVNYCTLEAGLSIRLVLLNPDLNTSDIDRFIGRFIAAGQLLLQETV
jgi:glutamate/tyrosine decarboxylase-like PLP-dependent enzyme